MLHSTDNFSVYLRKYSLLTSIILLIIVGIGLRFSGLHSPMQQDEVRHNAVILGAEDISDLKDRMEAHTQPLLSYMQKKYIWFNLIPPSNETSVKIPSAIYSSLILILGAAFFWKRKEYLLAALVVITLFSARQELLVANNARHYAYIAFCSMLFMLSFYSVLFERKEHTLLKYFFFYISGFILLNAHLFAWPLVAVCFCFPIFDHLLRKNKIGVVKHLLLSATTFITSISINWFIIDRLWNKGHHYSHEVSTHINWALLFDRYDNFLSIFSFPIQGISTSLYLAALLILCTIFIYKSHPLKKERLFLYFSVSFALLLTLVMAMAKSSKGINLRYMACYSPVFAIASSLLLKDFIHFLGSHYQTLTQNKLNQHAYKVSSLFVSSIVSVFVLAYTVHQMRSTPYWIERKGSVSAFLNRDITTEKEKRNNTKLRLNNGIKSISLKIRKEKATAIAFELSDHGHVAQWEMYNKYLYTKGKGKYPKSKIDYYYYGEKAKKAYLDSADRTLSPNYIFRDHKYDKYLKANLDFLNNEVEYDYLLIYNYYKNPFLDISFSQYHDYEIEKDIQGISIKKKDGKITKSDISFFFKKLAIPEHY